MVVELHGISPHFVVGSFRALLRLPLDMTDYSHQSPRILYVFVKDFWSACGLGHSLVRGAFRPAGYHRTTAISGPVRRLTLGLSRLIARRGRPHLTSGHHSPRPASLPSLASTACYPSLGAGVPALDVTEICSLGIIWRVKQESYIRSYVMLVMPRAFRNLTTALLAWEGRS